MQNEMNQIGVRVDCGQLVKEGNCTRGVRWPLLHLEGALLEYFTTLPEREPAIAALLAAHASPETNRRWLLARAAAVRSAKEVSDAGSTAKVSSVGLSAR